MLKKIKYEFCGSFSKNNIKPFNKVCWSLNIIRITIFCLALTLGACFQESNTSKSNKQTLEENRVIVRMASNSSSTSRYMGTFEEVNSVVLEYHPTSNPSELTADELNKTAGGDWVGVLSNIDLSMGSYDFEASAYMTNADGENILIFTGSKEEVQLNSGINDLSIRLQPVEIDGFEDGSIPIIANVTSPKSFKANEPFDVVIDVQAQPGSQLTMTLTANENPGLESEKLYSSDTIAGTHLPDANGLASYQFSLSMATESDDEMLPKKLGIKIEVVNEWGYMTRVEFEATRDDIIDMSGISFLPVGQRIMLQPKADVSDGEAAIEFEIKISGMKHYSVNLEFVYHDAPNAMNSNIENTSWLSEDQNYHNPDMHSTSYLSGRLIKNDLYSGDLILTFFEFGELAGQQKFVIPSGMVPNFEIREPNISQFNTIWETQFGTSENEWPVDIAVTSDGVVHVVGQTMGVFPEYEEEFTENSVPTGYHAVFSPSGQISDLSQESIPDSNCSSVATYETITYVVCAGTLAPYNSNLELIPGFDLYDNDAFSMHSPLGVDTDHVGNVYVSGIAFDNEEVGTNYIAKFNSSGELQWVHYTSESDGYYPGLPVATNDGVYIQTTGGYGLFGESGLTSVTQINSDATAVVADDLGNLFATGFSSSITDDPYTFLTKHSASGEIVWSKTYSSEEGTEGWAISIDTATDDIYVFTDQYVYSDTDVGVLRYSSDGDLIATHTFGTSGIDYSYAMTVEGNVYLAGTTEGNLADDNQGNADVFVIQLEPLDTPPGPPGPPGPPVEVNFSYPEELNEVVNENSEYLEEIRQYILQNDGCQVSQIPQMIDLILAEGCRVFDSFHYRPDYLPDNLDNLQNIQQFVEYVNVNDPFSYYFPPFEQVKYNKAANNEIAFIGFESQLENMDQPVSDDNLFYVGYVHPYTRAWWDGLIEGDILHEIDSEPIKGKFYNEVISLLPTQESITVNLTIERAGSESTIQTGSETHISRLIGNEDSIGYLNLRQYTSVSGNSTYEDYEGLLDVLSAGNLEANGWILDLRNNGGGSLLSALEITDFFGPASLDEEILLTIKERYGDEYY
ncbi:MAG: S41 family peptidase, partial [SAR324 cluster bacterium]|nr:S41 family peptidase [SAR324 cluster bacterium]